MNNTIAAVFSRELVRLEAESMGWTLLEPGVYLHVSDDQATEVLVTGIAQAGAIQRRENHPRGLAIDNRKTQLALLGQRV